MGLIYLDPPFNSNTNYKLLFGNGQPKRDGKGAQARAFDDTWRWDDAAARRVDRLARATALRTRYPHYVRPAYHRRTELRHLHQGAAGLKDAHLASYPQGVRRPRRPVWHWATVAFIATSSHLSAQPAITVSDSIVLQEPGDDYLVAPSPIAPDGSGGYLVADHGQSGVFHYLGDGSLLRRYGREGEGPGEWKQAHMALPWGDQQVMVLSWSPYAIHLFRRSDGGFVERHPLNTPVESVVPGSEGLWLSGAHHGTSSAIRRLRLGESEARPVLRLPDVYTPGGPVGGIFPEMPFAMWADTLLVGFMPLPYLIVADTTGLELDRFEVPAARRKGGTADPAAAIGEVLAGGHPYSEVFGLFSVTRGVHRRSDGTTLVVHFDLGTEVGPVSTVGLWVSVIDGSRESACVDAAVPLAPGSRAAIGFEGDQVLVLEPVIRGGDAVTVLRRIEVDVDGCDWVPISR